MNRRGFLSFLGAAITGATLDPERLLWRPGAKVISIASPSVAEPQHFIAGRDMEIGEVFTIAGIYAVNPLTSLQVVLHEKGGSEFRPLVAYVVKDAVRSGQEIDHWPSLIESGPYRNAHKVGYRKRRVADPLSTGTASTVAWKFEMKNA